MSFLSSISKAMRGKSFASAVQAFMRGDDAMDIAGQDKLDRPYAQSVWVQRAIKRVAEPIAAVDLKFSEKAPGGDRREVLDDGLAEFWENPAMDRSGLMDRSDVVEATVTWLKLCGEYFWLLGDDWLTNKFAKPGQRTPFLIARPDRMRPILDGVTLVGWIFTDAAGRPHPLVRDQVIHRKFHNPYDDLRGLGEYEAARVASEADYLAGKFALNMNRANGDRGVYVVAKGGMPSDEQREQIIAALREKRNAAKRGDFRPMFLTGDVAIEDPKVTSPDSDFVAQRIGNRHEVFVAFGVPPSMADLVANYSVGAASDWYQLIVQTCMPLANGKLASGVEAVSRFLHPSPTLKATSNFDDHPVMQQVRRERIDAGTKLWDRGIPWDEVSDYLDLGLPKFEGSSKGYLPFNLSPVEAETEPAPSNAPAKPAELPPGGEEDPVEMLRRVFAEQPAEDLFAEAFRSAPKQIGARTIPHLAAKPEEERDPQRVKMAEAHYKSRLPAIKRQKSKFTKVLMSARAETLAKIETTKSIKGKAAAADLLFDLDKFRGALQVEMRKASLTTLQEAGQQLFGEVPGMEDDVFTMPPEDAQRFLKQRQNLMVNVADEVFDDIRGELQAGLDAGDTTAQLSARVKSAFNGIEDGRALTVAQTEVGAAYGVARQEAMDQAGIEWKEWLTSGLDTVRATHRDAEGQRVRTNDAFHVGAVHLIAPGIPAGPGDDDAGELINCHCVAIAADGPGDNDQNS